VECLAAVDLTGYEGRYFQQLSGGEQQRVHIARVLCQIGGPAGGGGSDTPSWLFLDEPTQSLDIAHQLVVLDLARRHVRAGGGALAILHDLNLASLYADRLIVIRDGNIVADGAPESVLTDACVRSVFGDRVRILVDAVNGRRYVLPSEHAA
jgi:iron complex transport system ATP-binding protein